MIKNELEDELLEKISGGVLKDEKIELIIRAIPFYKRSGKDKFDYMRFIDNYCKDHPNFFSTDGSKEDYDKLMKMILDMYDTYEG